jgi:hypothetical protein
VLQLERGGLEHVFLANFPTKKYNDKIFSASEDAQYVLPSLLYYLFSIIGFGFYAMILYDVDNFPSFRTMLA